MRTSFSNKTEPHHTSILTSVLTSMLIFPVVDWARFLQCFSSSYLASMVTWPNPLQFLSYGVTSRIVCMCPLCHVIYHSCDKGSWRQSLLSMASGWNVCGRNFITGLTSAASPRVDISSTCKIGQKLWLSLPLLTCSPSAWVSWLLYHRGRKLRRDLWITLYVHVHTCAHVCSFIIFLSVVILEGYMA